jgi:hypothetical protein
MALLWLVTLFNLWAPGMPLVSLGILLNLLVIAANGGHMPTLLTNLPAAGHFERLAVLQTGSSYNNSIALTEATRLPFLGDIFVIPQPFPLANVFSVGDVLLAAGGFLLAAGVFCAHRQHAAIEPVPASTPAREAQSLGKP